jgi:hypothetical protein
VTPTICYYLLWFWSPAKVGVLRASHKIFLSLTGKFEWKFPRFHLCTARTFHANSPVRLKKSLWDSRTTATDFGVLLPYSVLLWLCLPRVVLKTSQAGKTHSNFRLWPKKCQNQLQKQEPNLVIFFVSFLNPTSDILWSKMSRSKLNNRHFEHWSEMPMGLNSETCWRRF